MEEAPCRMKNPSSSVQEAIALRRMSLVQQIIELVYQHWPLSAALEQVASSHPLLGDPEAPPRFGPGSNSRPQPQLWGKRRGRPQRGYQ